jgi:hypothetical protein
MTGSDYALILGAAGVALVILAALTVGVAVARWRERRRE